MMIGWEGHGREWWASVPVRGKVVEEAGDVVHGVVGGRRQEGEKRRGWGI